MSAKDLADEIDAALNEYLNRMRDTSHWHDAERARKKLERILWDNKSGIVAYLRTYSVTRPTGEAK